MANNSNGSGGKGMTIIAVLIVLAALWGIGSCGSCMEGSSHTCDFPECNKAATQRLDGKRYCEEHAGMLWWLTH